MAKSEIEKARELRAEVVRVEGAKVRASTQKWTAIAAAKKKAEESARDV